MHELNQLDILILIAIAFGCINGFFKGFISQLIGLIGFFIAIWISFKFHQIVEYFFNSYQILGDSISSLLALVLTFGIAFFMIKFISKLAQKMIEAIGLGVMNRLGGAFLGLVLYTLLCSSFLYYSNPILEIGFKKIKDESKMLPILVESADFIKKSIFEIKSNH